MSRLRGLLGNRTLADRLAIGGIAWIAAWGIGLLLAFKVLLSSVLAGQVDAALQARAEAIQATVHVSAGRIVRSGGPDAALDAGSSIYLGQALVEGAPLNPQLREQLVQHGRRQADRDTLGEVRYLARPITRGGTQIGTVVVSSDRGAPRRTELIIGGAAVGSTLCTLLLTFFALRGTVRRTMRPVSTMGDQASAWGEADIERRFDPDAGPPELRQLALTLNALLERIGATVRHERQFSAELSHELRTPLAHLHAELDLVVSSPEPAEPTAVEALLTSVRRLENLVESALAPARLEQRLPHPGLAPVSDVLEQLPRPAPPLELAVTGRTDLTLAVEADLARRAVLPVLENAYRYAVRQVTVRVTASPDGEGLADLEVLDDGGRLDPADAADLFEPGFRAEPADGHPGAGLGLALTRRICRSAGGEATAEVCDGITTIRLRLPCLPG